MTFDKLVRLEFVRHAAAQRARELSARLVRASHAPAEGTTLGPAEVGCPEIRGAALGGMPGQLRCRSATPPATPRCPPPPPVSNWIVTRWGRQISE
jgi:hypothetical protein